MHPLTDFANLSIDELDNKYFELSKRLIQARQFMSSGAVMQLELILDSLQQERTKKLFEEQSQKLKEHKIIETDPIKEGQDNEQKTSKKQS